MADVTEILKKEHGPAAVGYKTFHGPTPFFVCKCGHIFTGIDWENAGARLDEHLAAKGWEPE